MKRKFSPELSFYYDDSAKQGAQNDYIQEGRRE